MMVSKSNAQSALTPAGRVTIMQMNDLGVGLERQVQRHYLEFKNVRKGRTSIMGISKNSRAREFYNLHYVTHLINWKIKILI